MRVVRAVLSRRGLARLGLRLDDEPARVERGMHFPVGKDHGPSRWLSLAPGFELIGWNGDVLAVFQS